MHSGEDLDPDMAVCANLRESDVFLHVTNRGTFGHLVNADDFDTSHTHNELWELIRNRLLSPRIALSLQVWLGGIH